MTTTRPSSSEESATPGRGDREFLRGFLAERDTPCPGCGYNLRGVTLDVCPECAQRIHLSVGLVEPRMAAFLVGLIGLAVGLGFDGIVLLWAAWAHMAGNFAPTVEELMPLGSGVLVGGGLLWVWLRRRGRLRRMGTPVRVALAAAAWIISGVFPVWFFAAT